MVGEAEGERERPGRLWGRRRPHLQCRVETVLNSLSKGEGEGEAKERETRGRGGERSWGEGRRRKKESERDRSMQEERQRGGVRRGKAR